MNTQTANAQSYLDELTYRTIGCAIEVHKQLGAGLIAEIYELCFTKELSLQNIYFEKLRIIPVHYKGMQMEHDLKMHFLVEEILIVELKTVSRILPFHQSGMLTCMKLLQKPKGLIINFYAHNIIKEGYQTLINKFYKQLAE